MAGFVFYKRLVYRIAALENAGIVTPREIMRMPEAASAVTDVPGGLDLVGAWAYEQKCRGVDVSDEEIEIQRSMWAQEASA